MQKTPKKTHATPPGARLAARLIRHLLANEKFATLADLTDAFKHRCVQLRIRLTDDDLSVAYAWIGTNTLLPPPK